MDIYPQSFEEAAQSQRIMAKRVITEDCFSALKCIGGMDVSNNLYDPAQMIYAAVVCVSADGHLLESASVAQKQTFPYRTGLLAFREAPALIAAFRNLKHCPDVLMVDGHGICHPRGLGVASHIGVLLNMPTIGVGKTILVGEPKEELGEKVGSRVPLIWKDQVVGALIRTKARARPLIVSIGHKISLETAIALVMESLKGYRLPEPTRQAHLAANVCRKSNL